MKKYTGFLLATAGGVAAASGAQAADLPLKSRAMVAPPPPAADWAGAYIGLHAGVNWQRADNAASEAYGSPNTSDTGFIGGGQIGYNWQNGNAVYGVEADISGLTGTGKGYAGAEPYGASNKISWLSTFRGRAGLAVGNAMAYVTAGLAIGGVQNKFWEGSGCGEGCKSESKTRVGWAVGGGVEQKWSDRWTVGLEGLFVDLGNSTVTTNDNPVKFSNQAVIARVKANYKW